jgi:caa(3)-type oxidase subunit IV
MSEHAEHGDSHYIKIWAILLVLLMISFIGPMAEIQWLTLLTAFGIAIVKAYLVAVNFMHVNLTPRFVIYTVATTLLFMLLFFAGAAPDVMKSSGTNWVKPAWIEAERAFAAGEISGVASHGEDQGEGHGDTITERAQGGAVQH